MDENTLDFLQTFAVLLPDSALDSPEGIGFGDGVATIATDAIPLILQVEQDARRRFRWFLAPNAKTPAEAFPGGAIVVCPGHLSKMNVIEQKFVLLHEAGHHMKSHFSESVSAQIEANSPAMRELDADRYAADVMLRSGIYPHDIIYAAMAALADVESDKVIAPSANERIAALREALSMH